MAPQPEALPLAGITVAVPATRRAKETAALVRRWGGEPLVAPLLQEVPVPDETRLRQATEAVIAAGPTWSVHLTGVGTRRWFERAEAWGLGPALTDCLRAAQLIPRGQKATAALAQSGLEPAWVPAGETSAEISAWLVPRLGATDTVAVQLFGEPVPGFVGELAGAGAAVIEVAPYEWALPPDPADRASAEALVTAIASGEVQAIVITSAVQATHLFAVARGLGCEAALRDRLIRSVFAAAVGEVASQGLEREGVPVDLVAAPPRMGALVRSLAEAADRVRAKAGRGSARP
ncbi:MAG TPA: uroporphyrinogen-III synthase [Actinomycetota bacterium]|nr:uroporphyrinogen-III synthase [Actinomycetota bacterium]